jgi:hypothetical protein
VRWAGHRVRIGQTRNTKFSSENLRGRDYLEDINMREKIILKRIFDKEY